MICTRNSPRLSKWSLVPVRRHQHSRTIKSLRRFESVFPSHTTIPTFVQDEKEKKKEENQLTKSVRDR